MEKKSWAIILINGLHTDTHITKGGSGNSFLLSPFHPSYVSRPLEDKWILSYQGIEKTAVSPVETLIGIQRYGLMSGCRPGGAASRVVRYPEERGNNGFLGWKLRTTMSWGGSLLSWNSFKRRCRQSPQSSDRFRPQYTVLAWWPLTLNQKYTKQITQRLIGKWTERTRMLLGDVSSSSGIRSIQFTISTFTSPGGCIFSRLISRRQTLGR